MQINLTACSKDHEAWLFLCGAVIILVQEAKLNISELKSFRSRAKMHGYHVIGKPCTISLKGGKSGGTLTLYRCDYFHTVEVDTPTPYFTWAVLECNLPDKKMLKEWKENQEKVRLGILFYLTFNTQYCMEVVW